MASEPDYGQMAIQQGDAYRAAQESEGAPEQTFAPIQIRLRIENNEAWITAWDDSTAKVSKAPLRELVTDAKMDVSYCVEAAAKKWDR